MPAPMIKGRSIALATRPLTTRRVAWGIIYNAGRVEHAPACRCHRARPRDSDRCCDLDMLTHIARGNHDGRIKIHQTRIQFSGKSAPTRHEDEVPRPILCQMNS
eukprot:scaffold32638_cov112-Isochrysis_galbana.AAC.4